jgi:hypothetical protein
LELASIAAKMGLSASALPRGQVHVFGLTSNSEKRFLAEKWASPRLGHERLPSEGIGLGE